MPFSVLTRLLLVAAFAAALSAAPTIGILDSPRAGGLEDPNRKAILARFPAAVFVSAQTLTPSFLASVNTLILKTGISATKAMTPLSADEQAALRNFVKSGGTAILFCDNDTYDPINAVTANNSVASPFGLTVRGTLNGAQPTSVVNSANPLVTGPAGIATDFVTNFPGWFSWTGNALVVATLKANNQPVVAVLLPGMLGPGSGAAVFFGESGYSANPSNVTLLLNAVALQPTPVISALPQVAFGGGWYTALYFTNASGTPASIMADFVSDDGAPLVALSTGASVRATIPPHGAVQIEVPNSGSLQQGYAIATMPAGVTGYGVFRQSASGMPDQEAVVPLSGTTNTASTLLFDDTRYVTGIAVVNLASVSTIVTATARDAQGNNIGSGTIALPAKGKKALVLRDLIPSVGKTFGSVEFTTSIGNIAALGLRFNGSAFTSIPTSDR